MALTSNGKHFAWLDTLRFLAALTVVLVHTRSSTFVDFDSLLAGDKSFVSMVFFAITRIGNEAVIVFFVLSGFLVGGRAIERIQQGTFRFNDYAIDRFTRIMLPLFPALLLSALVSWYLGHGINAWSFIANLLSLQGVLVSPFAGNDPLWSLSYEVWFYVLTGALGICCLRREFNLIAILVIALVAVIFTKLDSVYLYCWLIGALFFVRRPAQASHAMLLLATLITFYGVVSVQLNFDSKFVDTHAQSFAPSLGIARILLALGIALVIQQAILFAPRTHFGAWLDLQGTRLAKSSYTLYLSHYPVLKVLSTLQATKATQINLNSVMIFAAKLVVCLIVAWLLYSLFEKHTAKMRTWLKKQITRHEINDTLDSTHVRNKHV